MQAAEARGANCMMRGTLPALRFAGPQSNPKNPMTPTPIIPLHAQTTAKAGWILLWLLGIPLPVLLIAYLIKGG